MRFTLAFGMSLIFLLLFTLPVPSFAGSEVKISEPFVNIYEYLDPKSTVIKLAKKGDRLPLVYAGTAWYQVDMGGKVGWVERKAGYVVEKSSIATPFMSITLIIIVLGGTVYAVSYYRKKQKAEDHL